MALKGTLSVAVRNQIIIVFVASLIYGFSATSVGSGAHIGGIFAGLLLAGPLLYTKRTTFRNLMSALGISATTLSVASLFSAYNDIKYAENPWNILSEVLGGTLPGLPSPGNVATGNSTASGTTTLIPSNRTSSVSPQATTAQERQAFLSQLNAILTDYKRVRKEYQQYHAQYYSTQVITITNYRDSIATLMAPLNFDSSRITYLRQMTPANATSMMQELKASMTDFTKYIESVTDSLRTSDQTEANQALPYLTKSSQAFQKFNTLYNEFVNRK